MDDDDKIRRNLIVTSAIIIGVAWFDVSVPDLLERLFAIKTTAATTTATATTVTTTAVTTGIQTMQVAAWKVWIAALVALSYTGWRYRWSDEVEKGWQQFDRTVTARYAVLFQRIYLRDVGAWFRVGRLPKNSHPMLVGLFNQTTSEALVDRLGRPDYVRLRAREPASPLSEYGNVEVTAGWNETGSPGYENTVQDSAFIDKSRRQNLLLRSKIFVAMNSKESMSIVWPVLIAGVAVAIAIYKLVMSLV